MVCLHHFKLIFVLPFAELNTTNYIQQLESRIKLLEDEKQLLLTKIKLSQHSSSLNSVDRQWKSNAVSNSIEFESIKSSSNDISPFYDI